MMHTTAVFKLVRNFSVISILSVAILWSLRWLEINYQVLDFNIKIWEKAIPAFLPAIPFFIFLWPQIKKQKWLNGLNRLTVSIFIWIGMTLPMAISQHYATLHFGLIEIINSVDEIPSFPKANYFKVKYLELERSGIVTEIKISNTSGRHEPDNYTCEVYAAIPIVNAQVPRNSLKNKFWLCVKEARNYSGVPNSYIQRDAKNFQSQFVNRMQNYRTEQIQYLSLNEGMEDIDMFESAIRMNTSTSDGRFLLVPKMTPFKNRTGDTLSWIFISHLLMTGLLTLGLLFPRDY